MLENPVMQTVVTLAALFAPFMAHAMSFTQYIKELTGLEGTKAQVLASCISLGEAALVALAYLMPETRIGVGTYFFLSSAFAVPGGYDLIKGWADKAGGGQNHMLS